MNNFNVKYCLIKQPAGLGDILFCQKIAKKIKNDGYEIIWPIIDEFLWLNDYITEINFVSITEDFKFKEYYENKNVIYQNEFLFLPLQNADFIYPNLKIMEAKYQLCNLIYDDWFDYLDFKRNIIKEDELYYDILSLKDDEEYVLVSKNYGSPPNFLKYNINIEVKNDIKIINLDFYNGFTLFDWCKVLENAKEIYMIDSSLNFIIEKLEKKPKNIYLYTRRLNNFSEIDYLFKTDYIFKYD